MRGHRLDRYPFPIANAAQAYEHAEGGERLQRLGILAETIAVTLGVLALGWCRTREIKPGGLRNWEKRLASGGVSLGTWDGALSAAAKEMARVHDDPLTTALHGAITGALPGLRQYMPVRNRYAHGGFPQERDDQEVDEERLHGGVSLLLDRLSPLQQIDLARVRKTYEDAEGVRVTELEHLTGLPPFRIRRLRLSIEVQPKTVLAYRGPRSMIELTPYASWLRCSCRRNELFYLHQRKKDEDFYFGFATGHEISRRGDALKRAGEVSVGLGMGAPSATEAKSRQGWRAAWAPLASIPARLTARLIDSAIAATLSAASLQLTALFEVTGWGSVAAVVLPALLYEPVATWNGPSPGKRLLRIEPISVWSSRGLGRGDALRRAFLAAPQLLLPPLAMHNLAWLLGDPARQCWHDRRAHTIVIGRRTRPGHKA